MSNMSGLGLGPEDFEVGDIQGRFSGDYEAFQKALSFSYNEPIGDTTDALRAESLDATLRILTDSLSRYSLYHSVPKVRVTGNVHEYALQTSEGDSNDSTFVNSGELPSVQDSQFSRKSINIMYMGSVRTIHHQALVTGSIDNLMNIETRNGMNHMIARLNNNLYTMDSDCIDGSFDSFTKQIEDGNGHVIDLLGEPLNKRTIEEASFLSSDNNGNATEFFTAQKVISDFSNVYDSSQRWNVPNTATYAGTPISGINTTNGGVMFKPDVSIKTGQTPPTAASSSHSPSTPTISGNPAVATSAESKFSASDAGAYRYAVSGLNKYGESAAVVVTAATTVQAGRQVTVTIVDGGGTNPATCYKIYRSEKDGTDRTFIGYTQPRTRSGNSFAANTVFIDRNIYRPNTFTGLLLDLSTQSLAYAELMAMGRFPLARIAPTVSWMQLMYGTPIVYAPRRNVIIRNIGKA
jgi:hypothetical protein